MEAFEYLRHKWNLKPNETFSEKRITSVAIWDVCVLMDVFAAEKTHELLKIVVKLKEICESEIPEFNIPELNELIDNAVS